jgi:hypothetical protein
MALNPGMQVHRRGSGKEGIVVSWIEIDDRCESAVMRVLLATTRSAMIPLLLHQGSETARR